MGSTIRLGLFDEIASKAHPFSAPFDDLDDVEIVVQLSSWEPLHECLAREDIDVIAVNLDGPNAADVVRRVSHLVPECGIIGVSAQTDSSFIISAMRAGCSQYVCWPVDPQDLRNALHRVRPTRHRTGHPSKRICVVGSSGGAGATTIACNLAMELAHLTQRRCALVDMNLEYGDVSCAFDCEPKYTIADICSEGTDIDEESLAASLHELPCNVSVLARPAEVAQARDVTPGGVDQMLRLLGQLFEFTLVDLPRSYSFLSSVPISRADCVLIVTQLGVPFIRNAMRIYQSLLSMGAEEDNVQIVLNRYNADYERLTLKDIEHHFKRPVYAVVPNDYRFVSTAMDLGHTIGASAPASKARTAIQDLARKLAPEYVRADEADSGGRLFGRLLGRRK